MDRLNKLRERIDWLDAQIASLLNERMMAADQVGKIKQTEDQEVRDPSREMNVLNQVQMLVQHPTLKANIANIYQEIMQEARTAQQFFRHLSQPFRTIGIIGLGLMGGSICKALKTKDSSIEIATITHLSEDDSLARQGGWIDKEYSTVADLAQNCELIILATPISKILGLAEEIKRSAQTLTKLVVIDIASVKQEIAETFEKLSCDEIDYVPTHPMAGKEKGGFANSQATLFVNRPWIVVPHKNHRSETLDHIQELIQFLGSKPISLEAKVHDQQTALVSHIPSILSKSYLDFINSIDPESLKISGPGFESFTRLAYGNAQMRAEICACNHEAIENYLTQWIEFLKKRPT